MKSKSLKRIDSFISYTIFFLLLSVIIALSGRLRICWLYSLLRWNTHLNFVSCVWNLPLFSGYALVLEFWRVWDSSLYEVHTISFQTFFVWAILLIVHTWNSSRLWSNLLRLQYTCSTVTTNSGRPHESPLVWACQWPSSQPLLSPQLSHNDSLWAKGITKSHREQVLDNREAEELCWCPSRSNSLWQGWSCGLVHFPGGIATDMIWRVLASSDGISSWTSLKPKHSNPYPNPKPLANQLWCSDFLTPPTPLIIHHRLSAFLESLMPLKDWCSIYWRWSKSSLKHSIGFCGIFSTFKTEFYCISFF